MRRGIRKEIERAYYAGVIDWTEDTKSPWPLVTTLCSYGVFLDHARRQGWHDAKDGKVIRPGDFDVDRILRRAESRERGYADPTPDVVEVRP